MQGSEPAFWMFLLFSFTSVLNSLAIAEVVVNDTNVHNITCHPPDGPSHAVEIVSQVIGWTYFFAWSLSFYPQTWLNWRRKSVIGLNFDFLSFNLLGYICYSFFNVAVFWVKPVQEAYFLSYPRSTELPVKLNDVIFSLHGLLLTLITIFQCLIYERGDQRVSIPARVLTGIGYLGFTITLVLIFVNIGHLYILVSVMSYIKVAVTLLKYIPQAYQNYVRKSTIGWSIGNILLDFTGGVLSFFQQFLDAINECDWSSFEGANLAKTGLSFISIGFDLLFMVQHYILYRNSSSDDFHEGEPTERSPLNKADDDNIFLDDSD